MTEDSFRINTFLLKSYNRRSRIGYWFFLLFPILIAIGIYFDFSLVIENEIYILTAVLLLSLISSIVFRKLLAKIYRGYLKEELDNRGETRFIYYTLIKKNHILNLSLNEKDISKLKINMFGSFS